MPVAASTCLAIALSIATAEPSTPHADVGDVGQLEHALHRAVLAHRAVEQRQHDGALAVGAGVGEHRRRRRRRRRPCRAGRAAQPARRRGRAAARLGDRPLAVAGDADRGDAVLRRDRRRGARAVAVTQLTSCSADCPPNSTTRWIRRRLGHATPTVPFGRVRIRASDVAAATGGALVGPDVEVDGASFDSRTIAPGQLFVPLVAERDGHDFIAARRRAAAPPPPWPAGRSRSALPRSTVADTARR